MKNFRLLVTKKISPSLVLQAGLKGIDILEKEFIRIVPVVNEQLNKKIHKLASGRHTVVFTSKNAVSFIAASNSFANADWKIFCIEGATKNEVKKHIPAGNIEGTAKNASLLAEVIA